MNIFILDIDPTYAAIYHCDRHVVKMILESAQILSTVANKYSGYQIGKYKSTHVKHPCVLWASESLSNWRWLKVLATELHKEYRHRYGNGKTHKAYEVIQSLPEPAMPDIGLTPFVLAMPDEFKSKDPVESYRAYYMGAKRHIAKWKNRSIPYWFK